MPTQLLIDNETRGREPGAYLAYSGKLYCVEFWEVTGPRQGTLHCIDARTGYCVDLTREQAAAATFIRGPAIEPPSPRRSLDIIPAADDVHQLRHAQGVIIGTHCDRSLAKLLRLVTGDVDLAATALKMHPRPAWLTELLDENP